MESNCTVCGIKTNQTNNICVLCERGITLVYEELINLLKKDKKQDLLRTVLMIEKGEEKSSDRRSHLRCDLPFSVLEYYLNPTTDYGTFIGFTVNISDSGLCLKTSVPLGLQQKIIIKSLLFTGSRTALVSWVKKSDDGLYKVGLKFIT